MLNVLSKLVLRGPRVVAIVGQLEPTGVAKHVGEGGGVGNGLLSRSSDRSFCHLSIHWEIMWRDKLEVILA